jgi:hypothetical protein
MISADHCWLSVNVTSGTEEQGESLGSSCGLGRSLERGTELIKEELLTIEWV